MLKVPVLEQKVIVKNKAKSVMQDTETVLLSV
jgi:hypothetical protein